MSEQAYDSRMSTRTERIEVVTRSERRRRWSDADKRRILQETLAAGATVAGVAKRHEIGTGQIYTWRRQALAGAVGAFVPIRIAEEADPKSDDGTAAPALLAARSLSAPPRGMIEIELPTGTRLRVDGDVDGGALRRVLAALGAR